ncbi:MAG: hypothetical protein MZV70_05795 [Desulfobacterales bacterium]|nr:hypothetical protein [Desulfobacterales bacterium]
MLYHNMSRYERALDYYTQSLDEARRHGFREPRGHDPEQHRGSLLRPGQLQGSPGLLPEGLRHRPRGEGLRTQGQHPAQHREVLHPAGETSTWRRSSSGRPWPWRNPRANGSSSPPPGTCWAGSPGAWAIPRRRRSGSARPSPWRRGSKAGGRSSRPSWISAPSSSTGKPRRRPRRSWSGRPGPARRSTPRPCTTPRTSVSRKPTSAEGDHRTALDYFRRFVRYEREILNEDTTRKIKDVQIQYEVERTQREAEIYRLRNIELKEKTESLEEMNRQILTISEIGQRITSSLDMETVVSTLYESLRALHGDGPLRHRPVRRSPRSVSATWPTSRTGRRIPRDPVPLDPKRSFAAWCIRHDSPVFIRDLDAEYRQYLDGEPMFFWAEAGALLPLPAPFDREEGHRGADRPELCQGILYGPAPAVPHRPWLPTWPSPWRTPSSTSGWRS